MFDLGWSEFFVVGLVALVVIGPRELPVALRALGQIVSRVRRIVEEFRDGVNDFVHEAENQSSFIGLKDNLVFEEKSQGADEKSMADREKVDGIDSDVSEKKSPKFLEGEPAAKATDFSWDEVDLDPTENQKGVPR
jgi:Tat protein translocase TatB subunit